MENAQRADRSARDCPDFGEMIAGHDPELKKNDVGVKKEGGNRR